MSAGINRRAEPTTFDRDEFRRRIRAATVRAYTIIMRGEPSPEFMDALEKEEASGRLEVHHE